MPNLAELREDLARISHQVHEVLTQAGSDVDLSRVTSIQGQPEEKAAWIRAQNETMSDIGRQIENLENLRTIGRLNDSVYKAGAEPLNRPGMPGSNGHTGPQTPALAIQAKGLRAWLDDHRAYKEFRDGRRSTAQLELPDFKALIALTGVNAQAARQSPVDMALEERSVADLMAQGSTDRNIIEYYEETTVTNGATMIGEGASKPESALAWTLRTETVRKAATWIPATKEALDDVPWLESQVRNRLAFMIKRVEEAQILGGDGNAPNLPGILGRANVQTQAKGADTNADAVYKAMQKIRGSAGFGFAEPTGAVFHPNDWTIIKLTRDTAGNYLYAGGPATEAGDFIWGLPVRQTTGMTAGTALVGAFRPHAEVIRREGVTVTLSTEHASYFIENKVAILAESRLALAVYRPSAFCTVTGIA